MSQLANRPIRVLSNPVAQKIAAGEVIDRPSAAVRELLDNAVDSGAGEITLSLEGGGIDLIRVTDNGCGMSMDDLELCWLPHATSKIAAVSDLERVQTLGFRGEALSSVAACSRLEIVSVRDNQAARLSVEGGKQLALESYQGASGTSVSVKDLFYNLPARRRFLKSSQSEHSLCSRIFTEKTAAHPQTAFRFFSGGTLKKFLPPSSYRERVRACWPSLAPAESWQEIQAQYEGLRLTIVYARPEISRRDRKYIQIYANRRRIDEFSLVQAVQYAFDQWLPGGAFPLAFVFLTIDPALVDFNIHPAKKEARFRDIQAVRQLMIESLKDSLNDGRRKTYSSVRKNHSETASLPLEFKPGPSKSAPPGLPGQNHKPGQNIRPEQAAAFKDAVVRLRDSEPQDSAAGQNIRCLGQVLGVFLVAERAGSLFIVDQHAAHERILFDEFKQAAPSPETLIIPLPFHPDRQAAMRLELRCERLKSLGIHIEDGGDGQWLLTALPRIAKNMEQDVVHFLESGAGDTDGMEKALWADLACKKAVKDNSVLDDQAALNLLRKTFALEFPRCPHGRPVWFELTRNELFELVGRTV